MNTPTIAASARISPDCVFGQNVVVMDRVQLGSGVSLGHNVVVHPGTILGDGVTVGDNAVLGKPPKPARTSTLAAAADLAPLEVGVGTTIGTGTVIYAGTRIGRDCLIADQAFVRERCTLGDAVIVGRGGAFLTTSISPPNPAPDTGPVLLLCLLHDTLPRASGGVECA